CARCGQPGYRFWDCPRSTAKEEDMVMAMGAVDDSDDSSVCSEANGEAFTSSDTSIEDGIGEYALYVGQGGESEPWVFDTGATQHLSPDSSGMTEYKECHDRVLRCAGGSTYPIVSRGKFDSCLQI
ncbi:unnamed protein product, partial [Sphacelaria rigidula]